MNRPLSLLTIAFGLMTSVSAFSQSSQPAAKAATAASKGITTEDVIKMVQAGISDEVIIARLRQNNRPFDLSADELIRLKKANVSDSIVKVMLNPAAADRSSSAASVSTPAPPPPEAAPPPPTNPTAAAAEPKSTNPFRKLLNSTKSAVKEGMSGGGSTAGRSAPIESSNRGPFVVDQMGLRNILSQYDPQKPLSKQFPHAAVTVLKSPPMWADPHFGFNGCWSLKVVVWSDEKASKTVGPFDWCAPRDEQKVPGPQYVRSNNPLPRLIDDDYSTGISRTDGPRPPNGVFPNDRETLELFARNRSDPRHGTMELGLDGSSRFAMMFLNLRVAMGQSLADDDRRVWIVSIK